MENLKPLLLGVFLGASLVYLLQESDCPVEEMKKCEESKKVSLESIKKIEKFDKETIKQNIVKEELSKPKERMKTPDELYEEQEVEKHYAEVEEEPIEEDRDVVPIELEQIERNSGNNSLPEIDSSIVPEALQVIENTIVEPIIVSEAESRALESDTVEFTLPETKEVIPEALMDLEEFGDSESTLMEDDIPN